ncbi:MAG: UDP-3-O-(3-hydroxymyristoyl)glucosamine N-acyltransferase, partial [Acidiferrobacterales bacterium]
MSITAREIQEKFGGELIGDHDVVLTGVNELEKVAAGQITFAEKNKYQEQVAASAAGLVIVREDFPETKNKNLLKVKNPKVVFAQIMYMYQEDDGPGNGIHPSAVIDPDAEVAENVAIAEYVVIRAGAKVGKGCRIDSGCHIGVNVTVGEDCWIGSNVTLQARCTIGDRVIIHAGTVVGADGFGYAWDGERHNKIPQLGSVVVEDDVEMGSNVCIDRATFGVTRIGQGTKLDNLVQIAHNVELGKHIAISAQSGVAGSAIIKNGVLVGGNSAISDHVTVGEGAIIAGASGVAQDVEAGDMVWGIPAHNIKQVMKEQACVGRLPGMMKDLRSLIKKNK